MAEISNLRPYVKPYLPFLALALLLLGVSGLLEALIVMLLEPTFNFLRDGGESAVALKENAKFDFLVDWLGDTANVLPRIALFLVMASLIKGICLYVAEEGYFFF